jgi:(p)ppGpp synthase/HD superfamily hydrolase
MTNLQLLERAIKIAVLGHEGQVDKAGMPYILHPIHVMNQFNEIDFKIVAILHDVVEDTEYDEKYLLDEGFPTSIVNSVMSLTKRDGEDYQDFIQRCSWDYVATRVKIADINHNLDEDRLSNPEVSKAKNPIASSNRRKKYKKALAYLELQL